MATINVTTIVDEYNGTGEISLREAVIQANGAAGDDTIVLTGGQTYDFIQSVKGENASISGDLDILSGGKVTIVVSGSSQATINAKGLDNVFEVLSGGSLALKNIVVTGGIGGIFNGGLLELDTSSVIGNNGESGISSSGTATIINSNISNNKTQTTTNGDGGGIYNSGLLEVINSKINNNFSSTEDGGGIFNSTTGTVKIKDSTISGNTAGTGSSDHGGGIYNAGILEVNNSTISSNIADENGGGIYNTSSGSITATNTIISSNIAGGIGGGIDSNGGLTVTNSTINSNGARYSGGIDSSGNLILTNSIINGNNSSSTSTSNRNSGGIYSSGNLTVANSTISSNTSSRNGGGINSTGTLTVTNSTISSNIAGGIGGGISHSGGTDNTRPLTVINSTISSNTASGNGGGINAGGSITINNNTITANLANNASGVLIGSGAKKAAFNNTILAANAKTSDIVNLSTTITSEGNNLIGNATGLEAIFSKPGDKVGVNPLLGPLQNNGGTTTTHALLAGSPAINAGNSTLVKDQRGLGRNGLPDIGAFELDGINDTIPPTATSFIPADEGTGVLIGANLVINFSEPIKPGTGNISIKKLSDNTLVTNIDVNNALNAIISGNQLTINPTSDLEGNTAYYVEIPNGAIKDLLDNNYAGITGNIPWNFQTGAPPDTTAPLASTFTPADNLTSVSFASDFSVNFSEPIQKGIGNILIKKVADNSVVETIDVATAANITVNGTQLTINPTADLAENTGYYVEIANGAIKDIAGNAYAGITGGVTWNFQTQDITAPTAISVSPLDNATGVPFASDLSVNFSEAIQKGVGSLLIKKVADNSVVETIDVATATNITVNGTQLTINPKADLAENTAYYVEIANGAIKDIAGNTYAGIVGNAAWNFQTPDITAPTAVSVAPVDNGTGVPFASDLSVNFSEAIQKGVGNILIKKVADNSVVETIDVATATNITVNGTQLTINPTADLAENTAYYVEIANGAIKDIAGNAYSGIVGNATWNFQTPDITAPTAISVSPVDNATGVPFASDLSVNFSEAIQKGVGSLLIKKLADNSVVETIDVATATNITVNGTQLTINPTADLAENTAYYVEIANGAIKDIGGNAYAGIVGGETWNFQTPDITAPTAISVSPVDNATGVPFASDLSVNFSEAIQKGVGNILIKKLADNSVIETIDVAAANITVNGTQLTINPTADLAENTAYYVEIANGAIKDIAGNNYAGIVGGETWNFQTPDITAPTAISVAPVDNATGVPFASDLSINFSEAIQKGVGSLLIRKVADNSVVETIDAATATNITVNGTQLTINPTADLAENTAYYVEIANGAIKDIAGNNYAGIVGGETWNFQTPDITAPTAISVAPVDNATGVPFASDLSVNFSEAIQKGVGSLLIKKIADNSVVETIDVATATNITVNGTQLTINPTANLAENTGYYLEIANGAIKDIAGNAYAGIVGNAAWNFQTIVPPDTTPPKVSSLSPADNATKVAVNTNLVVNFNESIQKGSSGNIVIKKLSDNSVLETIGVTSGKATVSGNKLTINPTKNLLPNTDYYLEIGNGAIKDLAGNNYSGITGKTAWSFKSITATSGADKIIGTANADIIDGLAGNDTITGLGGNDQLTGGNGADRLDGSVGNDTLIGGGGNDTFIVNGGNDSLIGGAGADRFLYNTNAVFATGGVGVDKITDFIISQNDKIVLDKTTFSKITSSKGTGFSINAEFAKVASNTAANTSAADIVYNTATGEIFYNQNGATAGFGTGGKFLTLTNKPSLTENQFIIQA